MASSSKQQRSRLDPCFSSHAAAAAAGRRKLTSGVPSNDGKKKQKSGSGEHRGKLPNCHPTILSHGMFHRHPSLSIEHFHFPSLSDSNPFPWLSGDSNTAGEGRRRQRKDSVFLTSSSWDSVIDRHLCGSGGDSCGGGAGHLAENGSRGFRGVGRCQRLNEEEADDYEYENDDVFDTQLQSQRVMDTKQHHAISCKHGHRRRDSRDPRWREMIAEAVRRDFDLDATRRAHLASLRVKMEPPTIAKRRLQRLLGDDSRYCPAGRPIVSLCDREFTRRLTSALERRAEAQQVELEARLSEAERQRELRLI